jgi:hypothetical protein
VRFRGLWLLWRRRTFLGASGLKKPYKLSNPLSRRWRSIRAVGQAGERVQHPVDGLGFNDVGKGGEAGEHDHGHVVHGEIQIVWFAQSWLQIKRLRA